MTSRRFATAWRAEAGIAVPIVLAVMTIALGLAGVAVAVALDTSSLAGRDTNAKAAIEAADTGARTAVYRLNEFRPPPNSCPTQPTNASVDASGLCPADGPETLGNGASFQYWVSRVMQTGDSCVGQDVTNSQSMVAQRCITAIGTVNGVSERVQERAVAYNSQPVFPAAIFGTKSVTISNNVTMVSDTPGTPALLGTNGLLTVGGTTGGGTTVIDGYALPPGAATQIAPNVVNNGPTTGVPAPYPVPTAINPGSTATNTSSPYDSLGTFQHGTCVQWTTPWVQTNCDYRIGCPLLSCDPHTGAISWDATGRTLYLSNNATLVLGGGYYNFCSLYVNNGAVITIAPGAKVSVYIDSPSDPNGSCGTANSAQGVAPGTFTMLNNATFNAGGSALNGQIYVYGDPTHTPPNNNVTLNNNGSTSFALAAPFSNVNISPSNNTTYRGAIIGYAVSIVNAGHFIYESDASELQSGSLQLYYRSYWAQCAGNGTPGSPAAGC